MFAKKFGDKIEGQFFMAYDVPGPAKSSSDVRASRPRKIRNVC